MNGVEDILKSVVALSLENTDGADYFDNDGYRICGKCHTRKEFDAPLPFGDGKLRVGVPCQCKREEMEAEKKHEDAERFAHRMDVLKRDGISDPSYLQNTFELDDRRNAPVSNVCHKYVANWTQMRDENIGMLLYGSVGTGKSFYACCIANALLEKLVPVSVTNFPCILNQLNRYENRQVMIHKLQKYDLLVIDDLGIERDTAYSTEQVFNIIDTRARAGKPLIVTTNLSLEELRTPMTMMQARIYDRVLAMCPIRMNLSGTSRRIQNAEHQRETARFIFTGDDSNGL